MYEWNDSYCWTCETWVTEMVRCGSCPLRDGYRVEVRLKDGRQWVDGYVWTIERIHNVVSEEDGLIDHLEWSWSEGNPACDCNKTVSWLRSIGKEEPEVLTCGHSMKLESLTLLCPDGRRRAVPVPE